uniref:Uncharacterized protein n=1 Tax=Arundo donax TaxID=35708 RepID=A0A0A9DTR9_ARUDO
MKQDESNTRSKPNQRDFKRAERCHMVT